MGVTVSWYHTQVLILKSYAVYYISYLYIRSLNSCNHWSTHSLCIWFNYLHHSFRHERIILSALIYSHIFTLVLPRTRLRGTVGGRGGGTWTNWKTRTIIGEREQVLFASTKARELSNADISSTLSYPHSSSASYTVHIRFLHFTVLFDYLMIHIEPESRINVLRFASPPSHAFEVKQIHCSFPFTFSAQWKIVGFNVIWAWKGSCFRVYTDYHKH